MKPRPNIVFIHTDQQRGDCLGCAGHDVLETPTMDNLAHNGAARIPLIIAAPKEFGITPGTVLDAPSSHHDIMPTLLDMLDIPIPRTVDGRSLYPLLKGEKTSWRNCVHVEHGGYQHAVTDGATKYVWDPVIGREHFFDLANDPKELRDLTDDPERVDQKSEWRARLIGALRDRPEGFVQGDDLHTVSHYPGVIPWPTNRELEPCEIPFS